jgi:hypothetical protein
MPELDGPGLYHALASHAPHLRHRFVFLTGDTLSPEGEAFLTRAGIPRLIKPFRIAEVRRIVQQALHKSFLPRGSPVLTNASPHQSLL